MIIRLLAFAGILGKKIMQRIELLPGILILLIALVMLAAELVTFPSHWDIDHMMYFGSRLLAGELHWTVEYDDKLPILQALFALPAKAHSIRVWQIMSALGIFAGCVSAYIFLVATIRDCFPEVRTRAAKTIAFYCAVLIAYSFTLLPSGITHISPMAASLAVTSIVLADAARRQFSKSRTRFFAWFLAAAFCASLAIGIRPYFLHPLVFAGVWSALKVDRHIAETGQPHQSRLGEDVCSACDTGYLHCLIPAGASKSRLQVAWPYTRPFTGISAP